MLLATQTIPLDFLSFCLFSTSLSPFPFFFLFLNFFPFYPFSCPCSSPLAEESDFFYDIFLGLLDLANSYCEQQLKRRCERIIRQGITVDNVAMLYATAIKYQVHHVVYSEGKGNICHRLFILYQFYFLKRLRVPT